MPETNPSLRILIAGAGIAGLATAISISRIANIADVDIQLYEQAPELTEIGASIALSPNGMRTLERLGVHSALSDEVGFRGPSGIPQIFRHWKTNQVVSVDTHINVPNPRHHTTRFHRGHLHAALQEHVPRSSIHLGKKVSRAVATDEGITLYFEDETEAHGDLLIGADGIKSKTRQSFFPEYKLRFTGKVFARSTFDASLVEGKIPGLPLDSMHWWGPRDNFFASRLGKGQYTTVGAYEDGRTTEELEKEVSWDQAGNVQRLREKYSNWNPVVKALADATPYSRLYPNYAGDALQTWVLSPRVTLVGDAAHTHGGAFAAGGSLALDDAYALGLALRHAFSFTSSTRSQAIGKALEIYDLTRRPHTSRLLGIVHELINKEEEVYRSAAEEDAALTARFKNRADTAWLSEHDVVAAFQRVIDGREKREESGRGRELHDAVSLSSKL